MNERHQLVGERKVGQGGWEREKKKKKDVIQTLNVQANAIETNKQSNNFFRVMLQEKIQNVITPFINPQQQTQRFI